jgi:hypothetical protein
MNPIIVLCKKKKKTGKISTGGMLKIVSVSCCVCVEAMDRWIDRGKRRIGWINRYIDIACDRDHRWKSNFRRKESASPVRAVSISRFGSHHVTLRIALAFWPTGGVEKAKRRGEGE